MSDLSDSLTVTLLIWATWVIHSQSLIWFEENERMSDERMSKFPALLRKTQNNWFFLCPSQEPFCCFSFWRLFFEVKKNFDVFYEIYKNLCDLQQCVHFRKSQTNAKSIYRNPHHYFFRYIVISQGQLYYLNVAHRMSLSSSSRLKSCQQHW